MIFWFLLVFMGLAAFVLTGALRRYALAKSLLDIPNERSSHAVPTPRGGGLAVVLTFLLGLVVLTMTGFVPVFVFLGLFGAGGLVAAIGWADDRKDIPARFRLAGHFAAAAWALVWLGGLPPLPVFGAEVNLGVAGHVLAAVYLVWLLNLYNFMDGINGIAGIEAITVCVGGAVLYLVCPGCDDRAWMTALLLAAATAGFLVWNFPRARIFMGDAGSGFLGMVLGVLSVYAGWIQAELFWGWVILLGAFIVDATVTLVRRGLRGEKVYEAHRSHAYQHAARRYGSHTPVSIVYGAINLFWLLPVAALVASGLMDGFAGVIIGYLPLVVLALLFKAGTEAT
ncbi:MAG: MraY family glycosyltransferase [Desulfobacterales bacterium]